MLTYGSLFTGIGGIDLGLDRAGWECRWQVESDPHAAAVLARHWPGVRRYGDIRAVEPAELEPVDLICGGFPCQPTSVAGRRQGARDDRWLWPEFARILGGVRPRWALLENPTGLLAFREFGDVLGDLAALGFDAEWDAIPAAAVGAPHLRDRIFVVAYARRLGSERRGVAEFVAGPPSAREGEAPERQRLRDAARHSGEVVADADGPQRGSAAEGRYEPDGDDAGREEAASGSRLGRAVGHADDRRELQPEGQQPEVGRWLCDPGWWEVEPNVGRVADGLPARVDRLTRLGNAVVPQVAELVGRAIAIAHSEGAA